MALALVLHLPQIRFSQQRGFVSASFGDPAGIRTLDTRLKRAVLCQLSYWVVEGVKARLPAGLEAAGHVWQGWLESNQRCGSQSPVP